MQLREHIYNDITGGQYLRVFPHLPTDALDAFTASAGSVDALRYWSEDEKKYIWGVRISISYREPLSREKTDQLQAAITRCWQWIDEQLRKGGGN